MYQINPMVNQFQPAQGGGGWKALSLLGMVKGRETPGHGPRAGDNGTPASRRRARAAHVGRL